MYFEPPPQGWASWKFQFGDVSVSTIPIEKSPPVEGKLHLIVKAEIQIQPPEIDNDGFINLPEKERRLCEATLENVANLIAIFGRCHRSISSVYPCAVLLVDDRDKRKSLDATKGFRAKQSHIIGHHFQIPVDSNLVSGLQDRLDGVALLAEAYSHRHESGRYREYVRFFEAAFALQFSQLQKKLLQFLNPAYKYTRQEIDNWANMRDPMTHADGKKSDYILTETDVMKVTQRMEQAALDVLFNKEKWHDRSRSRRNLWAPIAATTSPTGDLIIRQGSKLSVKGQLFDEFGVFPMDLNAIIQTPPENWWFKFETKSKEE
ncbi:MAG TPA: hypothetical protein ENJ37_04815 [Deltaproteobacteria bacterium]|nr:hypothetical protein [Deltaproteobacteria bacterium]